MLQTIISHHCPACGSDQLVKNGHDYKRAQKYRCNGCGRYGTLKAQKGYPLAYRQLILRAVLERMSLRGIERAFGVSRRTVSRWLVVMGATLPSLETSLVEVQAGDVLELDELWAFVGSKADDWWLWIALCRRTRQIVAYALGKRTWASCVLLWERLPRPYRRCRSVSDGWQTYALVFDCDRHQSHRKPTGQTAHAERWFNTLRQRLACFTRKSLAFAKSKHTLQTLTHLFILDYNHSCIS